MLFYFYLKIHDKMCCFALTAVNAIAASKNSMFLYFIVCCVEFRSVAATKLNFSKLERTERNWWREKTQNMYLHVSLILFCADFFCCLFYSHERENVTKINRRSKNLQKAAQSEVNKKQKENIIKRNNRLSD